MRLARRHDGGQGGDAAAGRDVPAGCGGIPDQIGHPPDQQVLHPHRAGAAEEDARVLVGDGGQEIAQRRVIQAAARDVGEVGGRRRVGPGRDDLPLEQLERDIQRHPVLGDRRREETTALRAGVLVTLAGTDTAEEALGRGHDRAAEPLPPRRARVQRAPGALELPETRDERVACRDRPWTSWRAYTLSVALSRRRPASGRRAP